MSDKASSSIWAAWGKCSRSCTTTRSAWAWTSPNDRPACTIPHVRALLCETRLILSQLWPARSCARPAIGPTRQPDSRQVHRPGARFRKFRQLAFLALRGSPSTALG